jgi:hypothetical protein
LTTKKTWGEILDQIHQLSSTRFSASSYSVITNNICTTFATDFGKFLDGNIFKTAYLSEVKVMSPANCEVEFYQVIEKIKD